MDQTGEPSCTEVTSCEDGNHTFTWPCDHAPGTGRYDRREP